MLFVFPQYNQEIHYVEPCLNGTLVRADRTNKNVSRGQTGVMWWIDMRMESGWIGVTAVFFSTCVRYLLALPWTSRQAVCQRDRAAGRSAGRSVHNPEWCKFQHSDALSLNALQTFSVSVTATLMRMLCKHSSSNTSQSRPTKLFSTVYWLCDNTVEYSRVFTKWFIYLLIHLTWKIMNFCTASTNALCSHFTDGLHLTRTLEELSFYNLHLFSVTESVQVPHSACS